MIVFETGEDLEQGHQNAKVLSDSEGLVLRAMQEFVDKSQGSELNVLK